MDDRLRASNADRDRTAGLLRAHFVAGRLTHDELDDRLAATLSAETFGDLHRALADLPGSGPVLTDDSRLERGYRRLLAWYPARYRRVHEEEMLAVLMTAAEDGQDRPGLAEAADLIIGALRVRCQTLRGGVAGWRGALAVISAGTVLGLLAGIPFASVSPPLEASIAAVRLAAPVSPATWQAQQAIASSYPVLARAARRIQPGTSVQALQSHVHISLLPDGGMLVNAEASTASQAARAAAAVADSYIAYVSSKNAPGETGKVHAPQVLYVSSVALGSGSTDVLETSGLGALWGALIGAAICAGARIPRSRRLRMT
jgi:hypothetical protein